MYKENRLNKTGIDINKASWLYTLLFLAYIFLGSMLQTVDLYLGLFAGEVLILLVPVLVYVKQKKVNFKRYFRLNKITGKEALISVLLTLLVYPLVGISSTLLIKFYSLFGEVRVPQINVKSGGLMSIYSVLIIGVLPAICEEFFVRGLLSAPAKRAKGRKFTYFYTALLFMLMHVNPFNIVAPFILGYVFSVLNEKTNSLFSSMLGHFTFNTCSVILSIFQKDIAEGAVNDMKMITLGEADLDIGLLQGVFMVLIAIVIIFVLYRVLSKMKTKEVTEETDCTLDVEEPAKFSYLPLAFNILVWLIMAGATLLMSLGMIKNMAL